MSACLAPPGRNPRADRIGWLDLGVVLGELRNLRAAVSGLDDRRLQRYLETAIDALVLRVQRNLEADGVWSKLAALDPLSNPPRTFQGAVYGAISQPYDDLRSREIATSVQVQDSQAISNLIVRGWLQPKLLPPHPVAVAPPRSVAFCYLHSALETVKEAGSSPAQDEAIHAGVQLGVAHLARALPFPQWEELAVVDPSTAPPATYQDVVLRLLEALSHSLRGLLALEAHSLRGLLALEALEARFNKIVDKVTTHSNAHMPPPPLISAHRARMYGVAPADLAARWAQS